MNICSITALQCHIMVNSFKLVFKRQEMTMHSFAHKTQLRFFSDSIDSLQYFQYVFCKERAYWILAQIPTTSLNNRKRKMILLHGRLEITTINDRSKFKIKGIKKLVFLTWISQLFLIVIELLPFVKSQLRIPIQGASFLSTPDDKEKRNTSGATTSFYLRIVYHWYKNNALSFRDLIGK